MAVAALVWGSLSSSLTQGMTAGVSSREEPMAASLPTNTSAPDDGNNMAPGDDNNTAWDYVDGVPPDNTAPHIPYIQLNSNSLMFADPDVENYQSIVADFVSDTLFVGARDFLVALDRNLGMKGKVPLKADGAGGCPKNGHSEEDCHNYIKVLFEVPKAPHKVYACGTNAFNPKCSVMLPNDVVAGKGRAESLSGVDRSPKNPNVASPSVYVYEYNLLFLATVFNDSGTDGEIVVVEMEGQSKARRVPMKIVVRSHYTGAFREYLYVFFASSESAMESPSTYVSRLSRLCADGDRDQVRIVSHTSATLRCGKYNMVQDVYYINSEFRMFAIFKMKDTPGKSAICYYEYTAIDDAFNGTFLCQNNGQWETCPARAVGTDSVKTCYGPRNKMDVDDRILMNSTIEPVCGSPVFETDADFHLITVKRDRFGYRAYVAESNRMVWNVYIGTCANLGSLQETWEAVPDDETSSRVNSLDVYFDQVYILTTKRVINVPLTNIIPTTLRTIRTPATTNETEPPYFPTNPGMFTFRNGSTYNGSPATTGSFMLTLHPLVAMIFSIPKE